MPSCLSRYNCRLDANVESLGSCRTSLYASGDLQPGENHLPTKRPHPTKLTKVDFKCRRTRVVKLWQGEILIRCRRYRHSGEFALLHQQPNIHQPPRPLRAISTGNLFQILKQLGIIFVGDARVNPDRSRHGRLLTRRFRATPKKVSSNALRRRSENRGRWKIPHRVNIRPDGGKNASRRAA